MDISTAMSTLKEAIASKSSNIEALQLAESILDGTFKGDLQALDTAKAEADKCATALAAEKNKTSDLTSKVETLTSEKTELQSKLNTSTALGDSLVSQVADLTNNNTLLTGIVNTISEAISTASSTISDAKTKITDTLPTDTTSNEIPVV